MISMSLTLNGNGAAQSYNCQSRSLGCQAQSFGCQAQSLSCQAQSLSCYSQHESKSMPNASRRTSTVQQPLSKYVEALDHLSTKLRIPSSAIEPTNALQDDGLVPGICRLFLEGRCRQGTRCFQVHANREVVESLRKAALETPSCCHLHGAPCNYEGLPFNLTVSIGSRTVGLHSLSPTNYLWTIYTEHGENHLNVSKGRICREHRKSLCRFGEECGFLHICREVPLDGEDYISPTPVPMPRVQGNGNGALVNGNTSVANACLHPTEENGTMHSLNASSFTAASFNGMGHNAPVAGLAPPTGMECYRTDSFLGVESGSLSSINRSRPSHSYRVKHAGNGASEKGFKEPLLRPLRTPQRASFSQQRHNPYADASSFQ